METKLKISLSRLRDLLDNQKRITAEKLLLDYNNATHLNPPVVLTREVFIENGTKSRYPDDYQLLLEYFSD